MSKTPIPDSSKAAVIQHFIDHPVSALVVEALVAEHAGADVRETTLTEIADIAGVSRAAAGPITRELAKAALSLFCIGRRGRESRIQWMIDINDLAPLVAKAREVSDPPTPGSVGVGPPPGTPIPLGDSERQAFVPEDMTRAELKELYRWVSGKLLG